MTSRERVLAALAHKQTDKIPFSWGFGINRPAKKAFAGFMGFSGIKETDEFLLSCTDLRRVRPLYKGPADRQITLPDQTYIDYWGVTRKPVSYGEDSYMEICQYPLGGFNDVNELDNFLWPSADWFDYSAIPDTISKLNRDGEYAVIMGNGNIFESSWYMRGFENMLVDIMENKKFAESILTRVTDFFMEYFRRALETAAGKIDIVFTADDIGQQEDLLISLPLWEEMIKPHHKRLNALLHSYGVKIMYHSDGSVVNAIKGLIDMGIDILEAVQLDAKGMDPVLLKKLANGKLSFHGGISVQSLLPFGTPEQVETEVKRLSAILGKNGGYILAPSHAIQAGTPPENIAAFLRAAGRL